jgi:hypothetical protein
VIDLVAEEDYPPTRLCLVSTIGLKGLTPGAYEADLILHDALDDGSEPAIRTLSFKVVARKPRPANEDAPARADADSPRDGQGPPDFRP